MNFIGSNLDRIQMRVRGVVEGSDPGFFFDRLIRTWIRLFLEDRIRIQPDPQPLVWG